MNGYGLNQYRSAETETVGPEEAIVLLYDGARRFVDQALKALETGNYEAVSRFTGKAQTIFTELSCALNLEAGEIATNLSQLYEYWNWRLGQGLMHRDPEPFREVSKVVGEMREAWADAARQVRAQRTALAQHG